MTTGLTRRNALGLALAAGLLPGAVRAQDTRLVEEMSVGDPAAPVTIIEYAMFTCPHCATFHSDVYPRIKADFIDTGKVRLVFREIYFNRASLWAAMIARCAPSDRYFGLVDLLFAKQAEWLDGSDPEKLVENLYAIGRQAGLSDTEMDACMSDQAYAEALVAEYQKNATADGVDSTPSFIIDGEKTGNLSYEEFAERLNAALEG